MRGLPYRCLLASKAARTSILQSAVALQMRRFRAPTPRVEPARRHPQRPTHLADSEGGPLRRDPGKLYCWCFAKKAAAFFRISHSVRSSRFSFRNRDSSSRSAVVRPVRPSRSVRACSTQLRNDDSVSPRSRAAAATVFPSSSTSRTALVLKSSVKLRRVRLGFRSAMVGIVSAFRKMSTESDQAQFLIDTRKKPVMVRTSFTITNPKTSREAGARAVKVFCSRASRNCRSRRDCDADLWTGALPAAARRLAP
jgi:hypothetical protein